MFDFPVWFDHVQMALFRVFVRVYREMGMGTDETGEVNWIEYEEKHDCGIFLSSSMAKVHYDNISIFDFVSQFEIDSGEILHIEKSLEMWHIDECNAADHGKTIEEKQIF